MTDRRLLLLAVGLLIAAYGVAVMPPMVERTKCVDGGTAGGYSYCSSMVEYEVENDARLPVMAAGGAIALVGGVLLVGD